MNKWIKITLAAISIMVVGFGLMAFRSFGDPPNGDEGPDHISALATELGISTEELEAAYQSANTKLIDQAVEDGALTQEQADRILGNETFSGRRHFKFPKPFGNGEEFNTILAGELGIELETLLQAQENVRDLMLEQALEDGKITQEEYEMMQVQTVMKPYYEEAYSEAFQNALDSALSDGVITEAQAELLKDSPRPFGHEHGLPGFGRHSGGNPPFHNAIESSGE